MKHEVGLRLLIDASVEMGTVDPIAVEFAECAEHTAYQPGPDATVEQRFWLCATAYVLAIVLVASGFWGD